MASLRPELLPLIDEVASRLRTRRFGRGLQGYARLPSTNTEAMRRAEAGAGEGCVVLAEYQTAGRGRHGRSWLADAGRNLMFSVVLRPALPPTHLSLITVAAGLAVSEAVDAACSPLRTTIKWPNDILLEGKKCCGMLLESTLYAVSQADANKQAVVILGIGLNVNQTTFPPEIADRATSLLLETGRPVERAALLADLLERLERRYDMLNEDSETLRQAYRERLHGVDRPLTLRLPGSGTCITGTLAGITETGALRLTTPEGLRTFHAGDVTTHLT